MANVVCLGAKRGFSLLDLAAGGVQSFHKRRKGSGILLWQVNQSLWVCCSSQQALHADEHNSMLMFDLTGSIE